MYSFRYLSGQAVLEAAKDLSTEVSISSTVLVLLVLPHEGLWLPFLVVVAMLTPSDVQVAGCFPQIDSLPVSWTLLAGKFVQ